MGKMEKTNKTNQLILFVRLHLCFIINTLIIILLRIANE